MTPSEAKFAVYKRNPFIGSILFNLPIEETEDIPTLGVDGNTLYVNMNYWNGLKTLDGKQQMAIIMHEAGHLFLSHIWRGRNRTDIVVDGLGNAVRLFNLAGDYVINLMIHDEGHLTLPKDCLLDEKFRGMSTEEVYEKLKQQAEKNGSVPHCGNACDKSKWGNGTKAEQKEQAEKWKNVVKQAAEHARSKGFSPSYLKRYFDEREPKEDWRRLLREYAQPFSNDYSFNPSDRRYSDQEFVIPDVTDGEKIDWIGVAIDTSGSIGTNEISSFMGELKEIMASFDRVKVKVTFCDAAATPFVTLEDWNPGLLKVVGGGGTSFIPPFELVTKEDTNPECMIYFTDGQGEFPKQPPYETLWVLTCDTNVPFGKPLPYKV